MFGCSKRNHSSSSRIFDILQFLTDDMDAIIGATKQEKQPLSRNRAFTSMSGPTNRQQDPQCDALNAWFSWYVGLPGVAMMEKTGEMIMGGGWIMILDITARNHRITKQGLRDEKESRLKARWLQLECTSCDKRYGTVTQYGTTALPRDHGTQQNRKRAKNPREVVCPDPNTEHDIRSRYNLHVYWWTVSHPRKGKFPMPRDSRLHASLLDCQAQSRAQLYFSISAAL
ncbi:hypothetical protein F5884DRAFT_746744 [Xylogone sp. PMI_703]|nr:hypothetical protein F5884DRAFT_746744 [Xylogone sp. PMI_703]